MPYRTVHYLIPLLAMALALVSQYSELDIWLAQQFYDPQHHLWPYQEHWLTQTVLHRGGRDVIGVFIITTFLLFVLSFIIKPWRRLRRGSGYILAASLTSLLIISQLKSHTHIYSPWDLKLFGGALPHIRLFDHVIKSIPVGYAFPAGHAGGGYILLSMYFLLRDSAHRYRYALLAVAALVGMSFGIAQQMRGAHMLSHDLTTITICWMSCIVWGKLLLQRQRRISETLPDSLLARR